MARRVLFLCTGNSCRSQMGEALWRELAGADWQAFSAGSRPTGFVHPMALDALEEVGVDASSARSKSVEAFVGEPFDLVITVCQRAQGECPVFPGRTRTLHWPLDDPAEATGSEDARRDEFRRVRDELDALIRLELGLLSRSEGPGDAETFRSWMVSILELWPGGIAADRAEEYSTLVHRTAELLGDVHTAEEREHWWGALPPIVEAIFQRRGWRWNGFYRRSGRIVELVAAAGPPVCATIERKGGPGTSGMCWDALLLNQTIAAADVKRYPGYHSCDSESGLVTVAGLVCPIRNERGKPIAVWDLDATESLAPEDPGFFDRYFATLSALLKPRHFGPPPRSRAVGPRIRLAQFLKYQGIAETGGHAKRMVQGGEVRVNGEVETRRGLQLRGGDVVQVGGQDFVVPEP